MLSAPRVSVVTAVFNGAPFVAEAIQSVLQQSFHDWELLMVDDGSTDETAEIVAQHAATDPRIALLHHEDRQNRGRSTARNLALRAASAPYVAFLDADDLHLPFKLEQQVGLLDAHPKAGWSTASTCTGTVPASLSVLERTTPLRWAFLPTGSTSRRPSCASCCATRTRTRRTALCCPPGRLRCRRWVRRRS